MSFNRTKLKKLVEIGFVVIEKITQVSTISQLYSLAKRHEPSFEQRSITLTEVERSPRMREIGIRSPVATDLSRKNT